MKQLRVLPKHLRLRITRSWFKQINYQLNKILHGSEVIFLTIDELWIFQMVFRIQMAFLEIYLSLKFIRLCYLTFCYDFIFKYILLLNPTYAIYSASIFIFLVTIYFGIVVLSHHFDEPATSASIIIKKETENQAFM